MTLISQIIFYFKFSEHFDNDKRIVETSKIVNEKVIVQKHTILYSVIINMSLLEQYIIYLLMIKKFLDELKKKLNEIIEK